MKPKGNEARGQTKAVWLPDEATMRRYVRQYLKKQKSATKRMEIGYKSNKHFLVLERTAHRVTAPPRKDVPLLM